MLVTTTNTVEGHRVVEYKGLVAGETILGANIFRDLFASIRDIVGGRSASYERVLGDARQQAIADMTDKAAGLGANAVIGVDIDYETVGSNGKHADGDGGGHRGQDRVILCCRRDTKLCHPRGLSPGTHCADRQTPERVARCVAGQARQ